MQKVSLRFFRICPCFTEKQSDRVVFIFTARCYAERGIAVGLVSSVRLSVTLRYRDHIGWNSSKIISRLAWGVCSLQTQTSRIYFKENTMNFFNLNRGGASKKWISGYKSSNISETWQDGIKVTIVV